MDLIPDGEIPCPRCGKMFSNLARLKVHTNEHAGPKQKFECFVCGKGYRSQELFEEHFDVHLKNDTGECDICHEKFETVSEMRIHKLTHAKPKEPTDTPKMFKCLICDEGFVDFNVFKDHQTSHAQPYEKYKCDFCGLCFAEEDCLKTHMVQCKYESLVQNHEILDTKRNTKCPYCKKFLKTSNLKRHVKMYCNPRKEARKVFFCKTCGKLYTSVISLRRHIKFYCKDIQCKFCDRRFSNEDYLKAHLHKCKVLRLRDEPKKVKEVSQYKCCLCDTTFDKKKLLMEHRKFHCNTNKPKKLRMLTFCAPAAPIVPNNNSFLPTFFNIVTGPDGIPVLAPISSNRIMILKPSQILTAQGTSETTKIIPKIEPPEPEEVHDEETITETAELNEDETEGNDDSNKEIVLYDDSAEPNDSLNFEPIVELTEGTEIYKGSDASETPLPSPPSKPTEPVLQNKIQPGSSVLIKKQLYQCDMCEETFTIKSALDKHYMKHELDMLENLKNVTYEIS